MDKHEVLGQIKALAQQNLLTEGEVLQALHQGMGEKKPGTSAPMLAEVLYYIGGIIIFIGIGVLVVQHWVDLNSFTRILVTLGTGLASYVTGVLFLQQEQSKKLSTPFFFLATILLPTGLFITFYEGGTALDTAATNSLISGLLLATYLASYLVFKRNFFLLFSIIYGTWLFFAITSLLFGGNPILIAWKFYAYRVLVAGLTLVLLGHSFRQAEHRRDLTGLLYGAGIFAFLGAALSLGGWEPDQSMIWELIFPGLDLCVIFLGVALKSRIFLIIGALYLMAYILKITSEYFTEGFGWPLSLVLCGLAFIAIGYYTYHLNRKYLSS